MPVQVTLYLSRGDTWRQIPLHLAVLQYLREEKIAGAVALHSVACFTGRDKGGTVHLTDDGGVLPTVVTFVDTEEHVSRVLPKLREMAADHLIVRENVMIEQGSLD